MLSRILFPIRYNFGQHQRTGVVDRTFGSSPDQVLVNDELVNDGSSICGAGKEVTQDECVSAAKQVGGVNGEKLAELTGTSNNG